MHANVTHLRRLLVVTGAELHEQARPVLVRQSGGYTLHVDQHQIDLHRFRTLASRARHRSCPDSERATILREALDLWSGQALCGVAGQWPTLTRSRWSMERLDAAVALLADFPFAEPLIVVLMRALHATGRRAEALERYASTRTHLVDELGADPGPELQALHHAILRGDADPPAFGSAPVAVPALLPMSIRSFIGRRRELALLDAAHATSGAHPTAVTVAAVSGAAGVGKTAWAHQLSPSAARAIFGTGSGTP
ncbi:hypothetical protein Afe04nite_17210 [Asanoa ferruginea]|uniref:AfsR/SARP family transcriptional regulator n=1 Tax=Asanoa ferruginea TaxID=53367 RepID=UPI001476C563|nr:AfsR/SARP family transcriptional regulator [Asanoa ferruginea]GIF47182.1 hypothetical protein Afe04nite_17210 [Asanoa ferruginea]